MKWRSRCSARPIAAACLVILVFIFEGVAILFPARAQEDRVLGNETGKIIYDKSIPGIRSAAVVVPEFTAQRLQETAAHFVDSVRGATLAELLIGSDENELTVSERGTVPRPESEPSFCETLEQLRRLCGPAGLPTKPIARVFVVEKSALLTQRKAGVGKVGLPGVQETLIAGDHDPTQIKVGIKNYRLLHFAVTGANAEKPLALFFKSSDEPSCSACRELALEFQHRTSSHTLEVNIRRDTWFASEYFPLMFRFEPDNTDIVYSDWKDHVVPPKVTQYYRVSHVRCDLYSREFSCNAYGRYEHVP